jgi:hypothetical protein
MVDFSGLDKIGGTALQLLDLDWVTLEIKSVFFRIIDYRS